MDSVKADHGYNMDSKTVKNLLQAMSEFTPTQRRDFLQGLELAAHAHHRVRADSHVQIRRVPRHHLLEQIVDRIQGVRHCRCARYRQGQSLT